MSAWILNEGNGIAYYMIEKWQQAGADIAFSHPFRGLQYRSL